MGMKLGIYFGWRWIFLGYTFDIEDLFGKNKNKAEKTEMSLNIYSSKFGVDLYYRKTEATSNYAEAMASIWLHPLTDKTSTGSEARYWALMRIGYSTIVNSPIQLYTVSPPISVKVPVPLWRDSRIHVIPSISTIPNYL